MKSSCCPRPACIGLHSELTASRPCGWPIGHPLMTTSYSTPGLRALPIFCRCYSNPTIPTPTPPVRRARHRTLSLSRSGGTPARLLRAHCSRQGPSFPFHRIFAKVGVKSYIPCQRKGRRRMSLLPSGRCVEAAVTGEHNHHMHLLFYRTPAGMERRLCCVSCG